MKGQKISKAVDLEALEVRARVSMLASNLTWLKPYEAACYMNIGESTLWKLIADGVIPFCKDNGNTRLLRSDIDTYWTARRSSGLST